MSYVSFYYAVPYFTLALPAHGCKLDQSLTYLAKRTGIRPAGSASHLMRGARDLCARRCWWGRQQRPLAGHLRHCAGETTRLGSDSLRRQWLARDSRPWVGS